jgi:hypothetical protein
MCITGMQKAFLTHLKLSKEYIINQRKIGPLLNIICKNYTDFYVKKVRFDFISGDELDPERLFRIRPGHEVRI